MSTKSTLGRSDDPKPTDGDWTVRADDAERVANALRGLMSACKDRLPIGFYLKLTDELRIADQALNPRKP